MTLPLEGSSVEKNRIECKLKYDDDKRRLEMAKDVAAFANANGGRILIGSKESGGVLRKHVGLEPSDAQQTRRDIEEAVRDWVRPPPVIDFPEPVPVDGGKVVLIVEVQPFPGQAVGVRTATQDGAAWAFPVRVGTQTVWYSPEQLVLLMDVQYRRTIQLLMQAKPSYEVIVRNARDPKSGDSPKPLKPSIEAIDDTRNVVVFRLGAYTEAIPIDAVKSVWLANEKWTVLLDGYLFLHRGQQEELRFRRSNEGGNDP